MKREAGVEGLMVSNGALPEMAKLLAIPLDKILVIDDGDNDIAMFEWSGLSIFMGNASPGGVAGCGCRDGKQWGRWFC